MVYKKYLTLVASLFLIFMSLFVIFADTNGVWHDTKDIRGGIFGTDEQDVTSGVGFRFLNFVQFDDEVYLMNNTGIGTLDPRTNLEVNGRWFVTAHGNSPSSGVGMFGSYNPTISRGIIQVYNYDLAVSNDLSLQGAGGNVGIGIGSSDAANEKLDVNGNVSIRGVANCPGKLYTDSSGKVVCSPTVFTPVRCDAGYFISGFAENGSVICEVIFGECGTSHLTNTYTEPTTNLCAAGIWQDESNTINTYNWKCLGVSSRADTSCYSNRKIDCVGSWSDTNPTVCSVTCDGGVKQQTYTITVPAQNGGNACSYSNGATRWGSNICNTGVCSGLYEYITPGTYYWTIPNGVTQINIQVIGGGGGGGGSLTNNFIGQRTNGGGGNAASLVSKTNYLVSVGQVITINVGSGGSAGPGQAHDNGPSYGYGGTGGTSEVVIGSTVIATSSGASGGPGGWYSTSYNPQGANSALGLGGSAEVVGGIGAGGGGGTTANDGADYGGPGATGGPGYVKIWWG